MTLAPYAGHVSQHTHIEAIRAGQQGYIEIGAIAGDPDDIRHKRYIQRWFHLDGDNTPDLLLLIGQLAAKYGNVYCSRVLYQQPRRDRALALPTRLLFLDDAPPGSYTYTIETSPQSMHAYILLDELISPDQAEQLGRRLAYQHGADQGGWDITQLVRVPGTLNTKARAGGQYHEHDNKRRWIPGTGYQTTLTKRTGQVYSVADISEATQTTPALPIDALDPASVAVWRGNLADLLTPDGLPKRWKNRDITSWKILRGEYHPKSSSEARYIIIASLVLHGYPDDEIAALGIHLTNFGRMETKGSEWLYRDIARCTRKARTEFAEQGKQIRVNPSRPGRTRAPTQLTQRSPVRRGPKCKGSPASYYARLSDEASGDQVHWTLGQAATEMGVGVATIKRWEVVLKAEGKIERVTVSTRQHSYVAILGQLIIHESAPNQAPSEVSSQISVQRIQTPPNTDRSPNAWENHRGASLAPAESPVVWPPSSVAVPPVNDLVDNRVAGNESGAGEFNDQIDDQAESTSANFVPLADDLADAAGAEWKPSADDQAGIVGASFVPLADEQAEEAPALALVLADDQAGEVPPQDELVCGTELTGPAGAFVVVGGAAYVPSGAESWHAAICAAIAPPPGEQADDQAEVTQLAAVLDEQVASYERAAEEIAGVPDKPARRRRRTCTNPIRKKLDDARQQLEDWRAMDLAELLNERRKLDLASQDCERSREQRDLFRGMVRGIDYEIGRKRSAGLRAMYRDANAASEPPIAVEQGANVPTLPPASEQAAPVAGVLRRSWRSPVARCDWDTPPGLVPPALPSPCVPELAAEGWVYERAGSTWRAVHVAGYETAAYINPEAAGRAVARGDYHPVVS